MKRLIILLFGLSILACKKDEPSNPSPGAPEKLIIGAYFNGANGINFDANDKLYVASVIGRKISVVNTETGEIVTEYGVSEGIESPDDLAFGPDGTMYWTSLLTGEVGKRTSSGIVTTQLVGAGVNPITFSDEGRLFTALDFAGDGLYELDPELLDDPKVVIDGNLGWLNAMDFGPDGFLYGPIWSQGKVVMIDPDNGNVEVVIDNMTTPAAVKFDENGNIYTVDHATGKLYEVDTEDRATTLVIEDDALIGSDNLAFNSNGELFLSHSQDGALWEVDLANNSLREILQPSNMIAADLEIINGELMLADLLSLKRYDTNTGELTDVVRHVIGLPGIISPFTIDMEGNKVAMTSWFANAVQVWNLDNSSQEELHLDYNVPINAILNNGSLIVAEILQVTRTISGEREVLIDANDGLGFPSGLAAADGKIFVADFANGKVYQVTEGNQKLDEPLVIASDLSRPEGLQIGPNGELIIVETGANQVIKIDLTTGEKTTIVDGIQMGAAGPNGTPPTWLLSDVHFDDNGTLYVASDIDNIVYKVENAF